MIWDQSCNEDVRISFLELQFYNLDAGMYGQGYGCALHSRLLGWCRATAAKTIIFQADPMFDLNLKSI